MIIVEYSENVEKGGVRIKSVPGKPTPSHRDVASNLIYILHIYIKALARYIYIIVLFVGATAVYGYVYANNNKAACLGCVTTSRIRER